MKKVTGGGEYYYLYNGHGDVIQIVDRNGNVVNNYKYDEWGNILASNETISNPFKYAGAVYDEETGLYYLRARYYDPAVGRFINEDSYEGQINNPLTLNQYSYCGNNPITYLDPTGHSWKDVWEGFKGYFVDQYNSITSRFKSFTSNPVSYIKENPETVCGVIGAGKIWTNAYINSPKRIYTEVIIGDERSRCEYLGEGLAYMAETGTIYLVSTGVNKIIEGAGNSVDSFISKNVNSNFQQAVKEAFTSDAKVTTLTKDVTVYRYYGEGSNAKSYWYTPYKISNPAADLALPPGNSYQYMDTCVIPKGTTILEGTVERNFGQPGGGYQYYVPDPTVVKIK